jgi:DNA-binding NarL/FixJ family response regulator
MSKTKNYVVFLDDDAVLVRAMADDLRLCAVENDCEFRAATSLNGLRTIIGEIDSGTAVLAIIDLWMIDKSRNVSEPFAGFEAIKLLRQKWPQCYILVYSAHIDSDAKEKLGRLSTLGIVEKPVPTYILAEIVTTTLDGILGLSPA